MKPINWKYRPTNAQRTELDGIKFASKKEAEYYRGLKLAVKSGELLFFLRQVPFHLPGNTKYVCDFLEFWANGELRVVDVKGRRMKAYIRNKKQVEATYPVEIIEA